MRVSKNQAPLLGSPENTVSSVLGAFLDVLTYGDLEMGVGLVLGLYS